MLVWGDIFHLSWRVVVWLPTQLFQHSRVALASNDSWLPKSCVALTSCVLWGHEGVPLVLCAAVYLNAHMEHVTSPFRVFGEGWSEVCGCSHCDLDWPWQVRACPWPVGFQASQILQCWRPVKEEHYLDPQGRSMLHTLSNPLRALGLLWHRIPVSISLLWAALAVCCYRRSRKLSHFIWGT